MPRTKKSKLDDKRTSGDVRNCYIGAVAEAWIANMTVAASADTGIANAGAFAVLGYGSVY